MSKRSPLSPAISLIFPHVAHPNSFQSIPQHVETRYSDVAAVAAATLGLRAVSHEPSCSNFVGVDMGQGGDNQRDQKASQALSTSIFCFILIYHDIMISYYNDVKHTVSLPHVMR